MSLTRDLLETYETAYEAGLVDNAAEAIDGMTILPIYHSSRKSNGQDVFEIIIDEDSNAVDGRFLNKDQIVIFPVTEESIIRSGTKRAPHPICDELSYLDPDIDIQKNEIYISNIEKLLDYEESYRNDNFRIIGKYVFKNTILDDFLRFAFKGRDFSYDDQFVLTYEEMNNKGQLNKKKISLPKIFIVFKIEKEDGGNIPITIDKELHDFYINFVENMESQNNNLDFCDITGEPSYCIERHRGLLGTAKLIGISNYNETYYGRFTKGEDIYRIGHASSQKVHNMLKYLIENQAHRRYLGENAYLINWLAQELNKGGVELLSDFEEDYLLQDYGDNDEARSDPLAEATSKNLHRYFFGEDHSFISASDFHVLVIEKISNGRLSVKYHRRLSRAEAYERVEQWYESTSWNFYKKVRSPSLYEIVNFIYGQENARKLLACENKKLFRSTIERLIPCLIEGKKLPRDIGRTAFYRLSNKLSYKNCWSQALNVGCALIKKQLYDYEGQKIDYNNLGEVSNLKESRGFHYGRLMAIFERIEWDVIVRRDSSGKLEGGRITNADKLWSAMIRTPEKTRFILEGKIKPYLNILKRGNYDSYVFYDKLLTETTMRIYEIQKKANGNQGSLNEDFILGYYYQRNDLFTKQDDN